MKLTPQEFAVARGFIEQQCGIRLEEGKEYLVETRLRDLVLEHGCASFLEFFRKASSGVVAGLRERIIDHMTTNETFWFRDDNAWQFLREAALPRILDLAARGQRPRIWSAAASTGQEAYSLAILLDELARERGQPSLVSQIEIVGTDISRAALFLAQSARYDQLAVRRGLSDERRARHFRQEGNVWVLSEPIRQRVSFRRYNLQDSLGPLGSFDLVLCRYVAIYFSESFRADLFCRVAGILRLDAPLLLGATESLRGVCDEVESRLHRNCTYYLRKLPEGR